MKIFNLYIKWLGTKASQSIENEVNSLLPKGKDLVYLDCGCDDGEKTKMRANRIGTKKTIGIDSQQKRLFLTSKKDIKAHIVDLNMKWPIRSKSIDIVTATEVIEHLTNIDNFFDETKRVLKKNGTLIISTENLAAYQNVFALLLGNQPYTGPYLSKKFTVGHHPHNCYKNDKFRSEMSPHINVMTSKALKTLLIANGFKIKKVTPVAFYPFFPPISILLNKLDWAHSSYVVISAEKK